ncbi:MAG: S-formylglutathione hydrolase [Alphaproteobacteria bacterium]|nr:S-formylglutathione hydrolase [Alphaproteobacteria bacterium]
MPCEKSFTCHGGTVGYYTHQSQQTRTVMRFSLFLPPQAKAHSVPYLLFLSGLTCTEENFTTKACAYRKASELGMAILVPDTSPRGEDVADDSAYDLGQGAGFYMDATQAPWATHFRMESYLIHELLPLVENEFPLDARRKYISGHSMGGHGALTLHFKYPDLFTSCSAFSPIVAPSQVPWGQKAFSAYLGEKQKSEWNNHDACALARQATNAPQKPPILIDQGLSDPYLESQLKPHLFEAACAQSGQRLSLRQHEGYDHSYFFIQSFIEDHLEWHRKEIY